MHQAHIWVHHLVILWLWDASFFTTKSSTLFFLDLFCHSADGPDDGSILVEIGTSGSGGHGGGPF